VVEQARPGKAAYDAAEAGLKLLREEERQKSALEKELAALATEQSGIAAALGIENREIAELSSGIAAEEKRLAEEDGELGAALAAVMEEEGRARRGVEDAERALAEFAKLPVHRLEGALPYLQVVLERLEDLDARLEQKKELVLGASELKRLADEVPARRLELERVQHERSLLAGRRESLVEGCQKIGAGDCPFFQEPCQNLKDGGGPELFTSRIEQAESEMARLDQVAATLDQQLKEAQDAALNLAGVEQVQRELEQGTKERASLENDFATRLKEIEPGLLHTSTQEFCASAGIAGVASADPGLHLDGESPAARRVALMRWSDGWHQAIGDIERELTLRLKKAEEPVQACALKVRELGVRRETLERKQQDLAAGKDRLQQRRQGIEAQQARLAVLKETDGQKQGALAGFAGVEERIRAAGDELQRYLADRDRFIAHEQAAQELDKRRETLGKYQERLQQLEAEQGARSAELQRLKDEYQAEAHEAARLERDRLTALLATLQAEIAAAGEQVVRLEAEIAALTAVAAEIARKLAAIGKLREQGDLVKFLRTQLFKNVSSQLSERFREEISFRADRIYRSIAESDEELFWGENYQIVLKDMVDGVLRERSDDQLSGGQMMSAVVALRLALLQTIGARIAFFDEPTSNLDAERRENLARAFRAIDVGKEEVTEHWYDQLFLVSHDVSFTEITDQMIHLDTGKNNAP